MKKTTQLIVLGEAKIGKTSMLNRYFKNEFNEDHLATLGIEFAMRKYKMKADDTEVTVKVWDTAGQERFRTIT